MINLSDSRYLSHGDLKILIALRLMDREITNSVIARVTGLTQQHVSRRLLTLEAQSLVERTELSTLVFNRLTEKGEELARSVQTIYTSDVETIRRKAASEEVQTRIQVFEKFREDKRRRERLAAGYI